MRTAATKFKFLLPAAAALACAAMAVAQGPVDLPLQQDIDRSSASLAETRDQIAQQQQRLGELTDQQQFAEKHLHEIDREMGLIRDLLAGLDGREQLLAVQSDSLQVLIADHGEGFAQQQKSLGRRLRALYMRGGHRDLELVFTAESFSSLITRLKFTTMMARLDRTLIEDTRRHGRALAESERGLRVGLADIWQTREEARQERLRLEDMDLERRAILEAVSRDREAAAGGLAQLQQQERRLSDVLSQLEEKRLHGTSTARGDDSDFGRQAGRLTWPVTGGDIARGFGRSVHPEFKTVTVNNGINIVVPAGTPVYAVARGRVEFADDLPGFGQCVILDHGAGYYTLYAMLDKVFVLTGDQIAQGEILAEVARGTGAGGAQLYFEVRQGKTPLDPVGWLVPRP